MNGLPVRLRIEEVLCRSNDRWVGVVSQEFASNRADRPAKAIRQMRNLGRLGMGPEASRTLNLEKVHSRPDIYVLKCKPSCWRLLFHVLEDVKPPTALFLVNRCKKEFQLKRTCLSKSCCARPKSETSAKQLSRRV